MSCNPSNVSRHCKTVVDAFQETMPFQRLCSFQDESDLGYTWVMATWYSYVGFFCHQNNVGENIPIDEKHHFQTIDTSWSIV